jgi:2-polyprenyl-6-methoxyphenol hydroxylase-like FAD-dependent oxidoreductase
MLNHVIIAGAGIGGLTLAAALRRRGVRATVLERAASLGPVGAGLTVQPNAMTALDRLGLAVPVAREGAEIERAAILDAHGRTLAADTNFGRLGRELGQPAIGIHRARLHALLLAAAGPDSVEVDRAVIGFSASGSQVRAKLADGREIEGDLLVGADGLRSAVRAQLVGDGEPTYAGYTSFRGVTPAGAAPVPPRVTESWGRGARFGIVPIGHAEVYWFAVADAPPGGQSGADLQDELLARFHGWHEPVRELIEATPNERILRSDIFDRPPIRSWHQGRVVLLGDAAHPMTPNLGQGGCQAIEDAVVLDACLAQEADLAAALSAYEAKRVERANAVVTGARRLGVVSQWSNPLACRARDLLMRLMPERLIYEQTRKMMTFRG